MLRDNDKSKEQLIQELAQIRQIIAATEIPGVDAEVVNSMDELRLKSQRLEAIVSATSDGIFEWDLITNKLEWDERIHTLVGTSPETFGNDFSAFVSHIHPDDVTAVTSALYAHLERNEPYRVEFRLRGEGDTYIHVLAAGQALRNEEGSPTRLIGTITDLSKSAKGRLADSRSDSGHIYRSLFERLPLAVFMVEPGGKLVEVNPEVCEVLGYSREELLQKNLLEIIQSNNVTRFISVTGKASEEGSASNTFVLTKSDASELRAQISLALLPNGNFVGVLGRAATGQYPAEAEAQATAMEGFERFARGLAHEFNNLLTPVIGYAQLSERALTGHDNVRHYLKEIQNAAERASNLTRQLLAFARRQVMQPEETNLNELIDKIEAMLRHLIGESVELETSYAQDLWLVRVDPRHIEQALVSMAMNAKDAMPEGGKLTIVTANTILDESYSGQFSEFMPGEYVSLSISDTGVGMTDDVRTHAMEPFFTTKRPGEGAGLGLSTCYGIVAQNEGHIEIISEPGQGSTFKIYFPRIQSTN